MKKSSQSTATQLPAVSGLYTPTPGVPLLVSPLFSQGTEDLDVTNLLPHSLFPCLPSELATLTSLRCTRLICYLQALCHPQPQAQECQNCILVVIQSEY